MLQLLEKILFYSFIFLLPFSWRVKLGQYGEAALSEYNSLFLYATDFILVALLLIFLLRLFQESAAREFLRLNWFGKWQALHEIEPMYWFLIAFLVLTVLASFPGRALGLSLYSIAKTAEVFLLFAYVTLSFKRYNLQGVLTAFLSSVFLQALLGLSQLINEVGFFEQQLFFGQRFLIRSYGTLNHPNLFAAFLAIGLIFCTYLTLKRRFFSDYPNPNFLPKQEERALFKDSLFRAGLLVFNFWLLSALFLTFSRTILILLALLLIFDFLYLRSQEWFLKYQQRFIYISAVAGLSVLLLVLITLPEIVVRSKAGATLLSRSSAFIDTQALEIIRQQPLFGIGAGYYVFKLQQLHPDLTSVAIQPLNNVYLLIAAETGAISLGFFVAFLVYLWYGLIKAYRQEQDLTAKLWKSQLLVLFVFIIAVSWFSNIFWSFQQGRLLFWLLLGIMVATATEVKKTAS